MKLYPVSLLFMLLAGCAGSAVQKSAVAPVLAPVPASAPAAQVDKGNEVVLYALGLIGIDYRFGGKNPDSGLDCSGMVSYIYKNAVGLDLPHNAAQIARMSKAMEISEIKPGDLIFFDTRHKAYSHVGIYIGNGRFVHAPGTSGKIKISDLGSSYFAKRIDRAGSLFQ